MGKIMRNMEKQNLLYYINVVSFAALDASLYLDSHPDDEEALEYFNHYNEARQQATEEYSARFGPLCLDKVTAAADQWKWATQPWPWEGGGCINV
ncbi:MAG: spore coat protein CotJB [Eubacterium sp.]|nr:spore coat protein CotJB [Eubacterium sp.]